jgi:hypothetical protein
MRKSDGGLVCSDAGAAHLRVVRADVRRAIGALAHLKVVATFPGGKVDPPWIEDFAVRSNW